MSVAADCSNDDGDDDDDYADAVQNVHSVSAATHWPRAVVCTLHATNVVMSSAAAVSRPSNVERFVLHNLFLVLLCFLGTAIRRSDTAILRS